MTENAVNSFMGQANSGNVLLYEGQHGVNYIDDIGKLTSADIIKGGDWFTEFRLYDDLDKMGGVTLEKADKLWQQVNGFPPYNHPIQKGFSIEGEIPDGGIVSMDTTGKRVIDDVLLDGVVVVPRPAYKDSIASAVYKALSTTVSGICQAALRHYSVTAADFRFSLKNMQDITLQGLADSILNR